MMGFIHDYIVEICCSEGFIMQLHGLNRREKIIRVFLCISGKITSRIQCFVYYPIEGFFCFNQYVFPVNDEKNSFRANLKHIENGHVGFSASGCGNGKRFRFLAFP
ncbi:MAG: hypothetical protein BWY39_00762 [Spirochaetes bacterium ADurb.Bin269]|nr:MAG: hypothetical protein BWY39_00762 [Spirochaetes bacterium ADurb.Bin269]